MDWQTYLTWFAIGSAGVYLLLRSRRAWHPAKGGCGGGCGCSKAADAKTQPVLIAPEQLTLRQWPTRTSD